MDWFPCSYSFKTWIAFLVNTLDNCDWMTFFRRPIARADKLSRMLVKQNFVKTAFGSTSWYKLSARICQYSSRTELPSATAKCSIKQAVQGSSKKFLMPEGIHEFSAGGRQKKDSEELIYSWVAEARHNIPQTIRSWRQVRYFKQPGWNRKWLGTVYMRV